LRHKTQHFQGLKYRSTQPTKNGEGIGYVSRFMYVVPASCWLGLLLHSIPYYLLPITYYLLPKN